MLNAQHQATKKMIPCSGTETAPQGLLACLGLEEQ